MPRKKAIAPSPKQVGTIYEGILQIPIVVVTEETENTGKGAKQKVDRLINFNKALESITQKYYDGNQKERNKIKSMIHGDRQIQALSNELALLGITLQDRACRDLAIEIQKAVLAFDSALDTKKGTS